MPGSLEVGAHLGELTQDLQVAIPDAVHLRALVELGFGHLALTAKAIQESHDATLSGIERPLDGARHPLAA